MSKIQIKSDMVKAIAETVDDVAVVQTMGEGSFEEAMATLLRDSPITLIININSEDLLITRTDERTAGRPVLNCWLAAKGGAPDAYPQSLLDAYDSILSELNDNRLVFENADVPIRVTPWTCYKYKNNVWILDFYIR